MLNLIDPTDRIFGCLAIVNWDNSNCSHMSFCSLCPTTYRRNVKNYQQ